MLGKAVAFAAATAACLAAPAGRAQDRDARDNPTAEEMIEVAREVWRPPGSRRRCPAPNPGEIVVCASNPEEFRVESSTDEAIRKGEAVPDGIPRAPYVFGLPSCEVVKCHRMGGPLERPLLIDLAALPHALTPEEAALVFRAEDTSAQAVRPEAASPAAAP